MQDHRNWQCHASLVLYLAWLFVLFVISLGLFWEKMESIRNFATMNCSEGYNSPKPLSMNAIYNDSNDPTNLVVEIVKSFLSQFNLFFFSIELFEIGLFNVLTSIRSLLIN